MALCLSRSEIAELTGTPIRRRQVAFLVKNGIRHYLDANDRPVVLRSAVESTPAAAQDVAMPWKPNKAA